MLIRRAKLEDLKRIQELNNELFELELKNYDEYLIKEWPLSEDGKEYFKHAIQENYVIVAELNNKVIGYLLGEEVNIPYYNFKIAELCNMCIDKQYRQQGVGSMLYNKFEQFYQERNIKHYIVTASFKNESAKCFYKKIGFKEANTTLVKF